MSQSFLDKLKSIQERNQSWLCVGLDPQPDKLPIQATHQWDEPVLPFNQAIIEATADLVCAYKPNLGFYLQWGAAGMIALERTIAYIPREIPIILDCKTGDIGHTQAAWARGLFDEWQIDAITVNPFVGREAVLPALKNRPDKAVYVLARTSNPSATDFQGEMGDPHSLTRRVIAAREEWAAASEGTIGLVVGATYSAELQMVRDLAPGAPFLIPGIGAQGGSLAAAVSAGPDNAAGPLISASRSIIYASQTVDFADRAREAAEALRERINAARREKSQ